VPFTYGADSSDFMLVSTAIGMSGNGSSPATVPAACIRTVSRVSAAAGPGGSVAITESKYPRKARG
jgi:hypothetical protein